MAFLSMEPAFSPFSTVTGFSIFRPSYHIFLRLTIHSLPTFAFCAFFKIFVKNFCHFWLICFAKYCYTITVTKRTADVQKKIQTAAETKLNKTPFSKLRAAKRIRQNKRSCLPAIRFLEEKINDYFKS
ncbi:hypothetical protein DW779_13335 [Clostridium sp. AM30-24]|nr:hypothetical protein DW779_13335 [Clostridium sp. AM30-24]